MEADLLGLLYGTVEDEPSNVQARLMLLETLVAQGHHDAAMSAAQAILKLDPLNKVARDHVKMGEKSGITGSVSIGRNQKSVVTKFVSPKAPTSTSERTALEAEFKQQLKEASGLASLLIEQHIEAYSQIDHRKANHVREAANICRGRVGKGSGSRPRAVREVARELGGAPKAMVVDMIVEDLEEALTWIKKMVVLNHETGRTMTGDSDPRERLVKRRQALEAALPADMEIVVAEAFMHVEHEVLGKTYVNDETMLGDTIPDIARSNFLATEDGYAWDMEELAQALTSNGGVMRNPLSKDLFSPEDVSRILGHPLGAKLRPMQLHQAELKKGVRPDTIQKIAELSRVLLADLTDDATESRKAVDEFLVFVATLPEPEQKVLDHLKVPGKDTHTGQAFDYTIGESVRDAKGNKTCFHKVGDFLGQASVWLGKG